MQNTSFLLCIAADLGSALLQLDEILRTKFKEVDCRVSNIFVLPEMKQVSNGGVLQPKPAYVVNLVAMLVSDNPETKWPQYEEAAARQAVAMKPVKD